MYKIQFKTYDLNNNAEIEAGLPHLFNRLTFNGDYTWRDLRICGPEETDIDFYVVLGGARTEIPDKKNKVIVIQNEPKFFREMLYPREYLEMSDGDVFRFFDIERNFSIDHWMIGLSLREAMESFFEKKDKLFSGLIAGDSGIREKQRRVNFVRDHLDKLEYYDSLLTHSYALREGSENIYKLNSFAGYIKHSDDAYRPYKYVFQSENFSEKNYFTEKIKRSIIFECLTFYHGCPNIEEFLDPMSYVKIDIENPEETIETMKKAIIDNEWETRLPYIKKEKHRILVEYNPLEVVRKIIHEEI